MKKLVWLAGAVLAVSLLFPNGFDVSGYVKPGVVAPVFDAEPDATLSTILARADAADKKRVVSVYTGLRAVLSRDAGRRINNTEKLSELQANTLQLAIEKPGKYAGLDEAIETVFKNAVKAAKADPAVVNPMTPEIQASVIKACEVVIVSAQ